MTPLIGHESPSERCDDEDESHTRSRSRAARCGREDARSRCSDSSLERSHACRTTSVPPIDACRRVQPPSPARARRQRHWSIAVLFHHIDEDRDGFVTCEELVRSLTRLGDGGEPRPAAAAAAPVSKAPPAKQLPKQRQQVLGERRQAPRPLLPTLGPRAPNSRPQSFRVSHNFRARSTARRRAR